MHFERGGYGYGVMLPTHHALEDYGTMLCLSNMHVFVPAFAADVLEIINQLTNLEHPAYLRLGRCEKPKDLELPKYSSWRRLMKGEGATILVVGPLAGSIVEAAKHLSECDRPDIWVLTELPEQVKQRPHFIRRTIIKNGEIRSPYYSVKN
ncbi:MAG: hypothetical protein V7K30_22490 [Nostoc sp.]